MANDDRKRNTVSLDDFKADPAKVTRLAAEKGPISVVDRGETVWRVSVPKAEPENC